MRYVRTVLVACIAVILTSDTEAQTVASIPRDAGTRQSNDQYPTKPLKDEPPTNVRVLMAWKALGFKDAELPFSASAKLPDGPVLPVYASAEAADDLARLAQGGSSEVVIEVCPLVPKPDGTWGRIPPADVKTRQRLCRVYGNPRE